MMRVYLLWCGEYESFLETEDAFTSAEQAREFLNEEARSAGERPLKWSYDLYEHGKTTWDGTWYYVTDHSVK